MPSALLLFEWPHPPLSALLKRGGHICTDWGARLWNLLLQKDQALEHLGVGFFDFGITKGTT